MKIVDQELTVDATPDSLWEVWTDVDGWPDWDPHERAARLDGAFAAGGTGWSKPRGAPAGTFELVEVERARAWVSRSAIPGGHLLFTHSITAGDGDRRAVRLRSEAHGPMAGLIALGWGRRMRADAVLTLRALGERASALDAAPKTAPGKSR